MRRLMVLGLVGFVLASCGNAVEDAGTDDFTEATAGAGASPAAPTSSIPGEAVIPAESDVPDSIAPSHEPAPPVEVSAPRQRPLADLAVQDLAGLLDLDPSEIEVDIVEAVTWRDGSIGCPQPGMSYTQALVPGTRIILMHAGIHYHYHATDRREPFYCAAPVEPLGSDGVGSPDL